MSTRHAPQQRDDRRDGMDSPTAAVAALWGSVLPIATGPGAGDDFEARVGRAWGYIKASHFTAAEHDRLRELLDSEATSNE